MKTLYLECNMGAAGDMLMAALYEICDKKDFFEKTMNRAFSKYGITVSAEPSVKCGIAGTHMHVVINGAEEGHEGHGHEHAANENAPSHEHAANENAHPHEHAHMHSDYVSVLKQINELMLPEPVRKNAAEIYRLIGNAEAKVHNTTLEHIHFHEVGSLDALADVCGCALLIHLIAPDHIYASPLHVGSGFVRCAHGVLPVPAPATAELLKGIPFYGGSVAGELLTPTGAAVLRHYVEKFQSMPVMTLLETGCGMGRKDFEIANCVRAFLGEQEEPFSSGAAPALSCDDKILGIFCNLDDMTGESISFACEVLFNEGALDVYTTPIYMKKGRPGIILTCLCKMEDRDKFTSLFFKHTTTRGIRFTVFERAKLVSSVETKQTSFGEIHIKKSTGYGTETEKPEFDDLRAAALKAGCSLSEITKQF